MGPRLLLAASCQSFSIYIGRSDTSCIADSFLLIIQIKLKICEVNHYEEEAEKRRLNHMISLL